MYSDLFEELSTYKSCVHIGMFVKGIKKKFMPNEKSLLRNGVTVRRSRAGAGV